MTRDARHALWEASDRLWWLQEQQYMIVDWLMATNVDDFPRDRRYIKAKGILEGLRVAEKELNEMARADK